MGARRIEWMGESAIRKATEIVARLKEMMRAVSDFDGPMIKIGD
jgi:hypothetical protein